MTDDSGRYLRPTSDVGEIDLRKLLHALWVRRMLIGGVTVVTTGIVAIAVLMIPNIYRAEALLAPNNKDVASNLSALANQYGGLASLAGININPSSGDKTVFGVEILKSRKFISGFVRRHDILVPLLAAKGWNHDTGKINLDADKYDVASETWVRKMKPPRQSIPSMLEAYSEFTKRLFVRRSKETGFVTVSVEHYSPVIAKQWVDWLVDDINMLTMMRDVEDAKESIAFLHEQVEATPLAEMKSVFFRLIEEQTKIMLLAEVSNEYLFRTIDPAVVPEEKSRPRRVLITLFASIFSMSLACFYCLLDTRRRPVLRKQE